MQACVVNKRLIIAPCKGWNIYIDTLQFSLNMRSLCSFWLSDSVIIDIYRIYHSCAVINCHCIIVVSWNICLKIWPFILLAQFCIACLLRKLIKLAIPFLVVFTRRSRKRRLKFRRLLNCSWILLLVFWNLSWRSLEAFRNCRWDRLAVVLSTRRWFSFISTEYYRVNLVK